MRDVLENISGCLGQAQTGAECVYRKACGEEPDQRWQPHLPHRKAEEEGKGNADDFEYRPPPSLRI